MPPTAVRWTAPRILAEDLHAPAEPLALLLGPGREAPPAAVASRAARALLDLPALPPGARGGPPPWLAPHQVPAAERLSPLLDRYGGALLADAVGLGKSYVALAVAVMRAEPFALVVPAVLVPQWRQLLQRLDLKTPVITHEALSGHIIRPSAVPPVRLFVVDEAHRFRNPETRRFRALATLVVGARVLLVTATPVHNRVADLFHLFRLFLRDHELAGLGVPSLRRAARGELPAATIAAVAARLIVARSRGRVQAAAYGAGRALTFPRRVAAPGLCAPPLPEPLLEAIVAGVCRLAAGAAAAPLFRLTLLRRLASSLPAFRASLERYGAFLELARRAATDHRALAPRDFQRLFPAAAPDEGDLQLLLFPLLLQPGGETAPDRDETAVAELRRLAAAAAAVDPKRDALIALLEGSTTRTIVFTDSRVTARYLQRHLARRCRLAVLWGDDGWLGTARASRAEVLRSFAPLAQGASPPPDALRADVLVATDLLSEGLNLQDAARVVHYDLPWTPARLAQRAGRVDRLGSPHALVETVAFHPPPALEAAVQLESRLAAKARAAALAGQAATDPADGYAGQGTALDWTDRLQRLHRGDELPHDRGLVAAVRGAADAAVLVVRLGTAVEAIVVEKGEARADPRAATAHLEDALGVPATPLDDRLIENAVRIAAPLVRERLAALADARWRASDRDRLSRRLIPWVLAEARRAARRREAGRLAVLDALVARLAAGMTAGEELLLERLLERRAPLTIAALIEWHGALPPLGEPVGTMEVALVAALQVRR